MSGENKMTIFNPFNNDFECSICYDYCYDNKVDCRTCSASICKKCYDELNKNKALRNKCVVCRKAMRNKILRGIVRVYEFNICQFDENDRNILFDVAKFFKGERVGIQLNNLEWFSKLLPIHAERDEFGRIKKWKGKRIIWETLFPQHKKEPITQARTRDEFGHYNFMLNQKYQILFYNKQQNKLSWQPTSLEVYKKNTASVKLRINNDSLPPTPASRFRHTDKCYKVMKTVRLQDVSLTGCKMGNYIVLDTNKEGIFFINSMM